jgi:hypothetical protein
MPVQVEPDEAKLQELMGTIMGYMVGTAAVYGMLLGDELGLHREMENAGPISADALADKPDAFGAWSANGWMATPPARS